MYIKPIGWEFTASDFCCANFKIHAFTDGADSPDFTISRSGVTVLYRGNGIAYCPYCGKKIELKKVDE